MILALRVAVATSLATPIAVTAQPARVADTRAVEAVLSQYKAAIEKLDAKGTERFFAADLQIFETGGSEGKLRHLPRPSSWARAGGVQVVHIFRLQGQRSL